MQNCQSAHYQNQNSNNNKNPKDRRTLFQVWCQCASVVLVQTYIIETSRWYPGLQLLKLTPLNVNLEKTTFLVNSSLKAPWGSLWWCSHDRSCNKEVEQCRQYSHQDFRLTSSIYPGEVWAWHCLTEVWSWHFWSPDPVYGSVSWFLFCLGSRQCGRIHGRCIQSCPSSPQRTSRRWFQRSRPCTVTNPSSQMQNMIIRQHS